MPAGSELYLWAQRSGLALCPTAATRRVRRGRPPSGGALCLPRCSGAGLFRAGAELFWAGPGPGDSEPCRAGPGRTRPRRRARARSAISWPPLRLQPELREYSPNLFYPEKWLLKLWMLRLYLQSSMFLYLWLNIFFLFFINLFLPML